MKSLLTKIISMLTIVTLCIGLTACNATADKCADGHTWKLASTTATCYEGGVESYECEVCGATKTENVEAYRHDMVQSSYTAPTCKTTGERVDKCSRCGFESKQTLLQIDHDWQTKSTVPSTCTVKGSQQLECSMCHETKTVELPLAEHDYTEIESPIATCFSDGSIKNICNDCQHEEFIDSTEMLTHEFGADGYCTKCGIYKTLFNEAELGVTWVPYQGNGVNHVFDDIHGYLKPKFNNDNAIPDEYFIEHSISISLSFYDNDNNLLESKEFFSFIIPWDGFGYMGKPTIQFGGSTNGYAYEFMLRFWLQKAFEESTLENAASLKLELCCQGYETIEKTYEVTNG